MNCRISTKNVWGLKHNQRQIVLSQANCHFQLRVFNNYLLFCSSYRLCFIDHNNIYEVLYNHVALKVTILNVNER